MAPRTIELSLRSATDRLRLTGSSSPRLDAELLLAAILGLERAHLYTRSDSVVDASALERFEALVERRAAHEPVAYLLGEAHFRRLRLAVDPAVLIPRPETEELVDVALEVLRRRPAWPAESSPGARPEPTAAQPGALIADVGTGSGAIALSLASEAHLAVIATDVSADALRVAAANAAATGLASLVELRQTDLLAGIADGSLHLVVSNPPYVTSGDYESLAPDVRLYEPAGALDAGTDGLDVIRGLLPEAARALRPGGTVMLEVGYDQARRVCDLAVAAGFAFTTVHRDLSGKDRFVEATLPGVCIMAMPATREPAADEPAPIARAAELTAAPARATAPDALPAASTPRWVAQLRDALSAGAIIGVPTDTVYGIAARWDSPGGVKRLFAAKGRAPQQPVQVLFPSVEAIVRCLPDLEARAAAVLAALLPGPYTFIVATMVARPEHVGTPDSLGVRVPDLPALLALLRLLDSPLAATSANLSGRPDVRALAETDPAVLAHCSVAFDPAAVGADGFCLPGAARRGGEADGVSPGLTQPAGASAGAGVEGTPAVPGKASTVVDLRPLSRGEAPLVLREGAVSAAEVLRRIAGLV